MAGSGGRQSPDLIQELLQNPQQFDFFQAVRIIERCVAEDPAPRWPSAVGSDRGPHTEPIRFRALPSLSFPPGEVAALQIDKTRLPKGLRAGRTDAGPESQRDVSLTTSEAGEASLPDQHRPLDPLEMTVSFMGLTGPNGVLPQHYTTLLIERAHQRFKDPTLREFFDLFNHRLISLFYRAWEKYRLPIVYARNQQEGNVSDDLFTRCFFSLVGLQIKGLRHRFTFDDQTIISYGGLFAQQCRNAIGLQQILSSYFQVQAEVVQFCGQWLYLPEDTQSCLPSKQHPDGLNLKLGESAVVGFRAWDVQSRIRIRLGPLSSWQFQELLPGGGRLKAVAELVRFYVGPNIDFDVQLVLKSSDVPECRLCPEGENAPRLGWNTWMTSTRTYEYAEEAIFRL